MFKSGFFAIIGRPNVGKSTLLNTVLNSKVAIVSAKAQTTRNKITGVYTDEECQIVFVDTPGIHKPKHKLGDYMNKSAWNASRGIEGILFLVPADESWGTGDQYVLDNISKSGVPIILVISKVDKVDHKTLVSRIEELKEKADFEDIIPISSQTRHNIDHLKTLLKSKLVPGPKFYPDNMVTDKPERFIMAELIREKILVLTHEEVPHSIAVVIDKVEKKSSGNTISVMATIIVERASQKGIVIGKGGQLLKEIGKRARHDMELLLGSKVFLETFVKVKEDWRNKMSDLEAYGYSKND